ncbi:hypothetical protein DRH14_02695 [Candidatus Shapirobacteria bacterium]|nr:MAG: hypothetical protein DRH14_02695 [Candidatus Shapirobacteria bacterium]
MNNSQLYSQLKNHFPQLKIEKDFPLAPLTTLKIGGPAEIFIQTTTNQQLIQLFKYLHTISYPLSSIHFLGNGSNTLISDSGIRGIIIKNTSSNFQLISTPTTFQNTNTSPITPTQKTRHYENDPKKYLSLKQFDYDESNSPLQFVDIDTGLDLSQAIKKSLAQQVTGLQWFSYIPGQIGGAIWYNAHGGNHHISNVIHNITFYNLKTQKTETVLASNIDWQYDSSFFQQNPHLFILSAIFKLYQGDTHKAQQIVNRWIAEKKKVQSFNSCGSVFQNLPESITVPIWGQPRSTGWIVDQQLHLKGKKIGNAQISEKHGNFILNAGQATASDYLKLIRLVQQQFKQRWNIDLPLEVNLLGNFD